MPYRVLHLNLQEHGELSLWLLLELSHVARHLQSVCRDSLEYSQFDRDLPSRIHPSLVSSQSIDKMLASESPMLLDTLKAI